MLGVLRALALIVALALAAPGAAAAAGGPTGSGDASSAQYAPFLSGQGGPLEGGYSPPVLNPSSPSSLGGWQLACALASLIALAAAVGLHVRERRARDRRALVQGSRH